MTPQEQIDLLRNACQTALQCHGVTLASYPPQDAWAYHRVSEKLSAALATSLPAQPVAEGYEELARLAMAATPGPWTVGDKVKRFIYAADDTPICECDSIGEAANKEDDTAAYIAAANPAAIIALLADLQFKQGYIEAQDDSFATMMADRAQLAERVVVLEAALKAIKFCTAVPARQNMRHIATEALAATPQPHADEAAKGVPVHQFLNDTENGVKNWSDCEEGELAAWAALGIEHRTLYTAPPSPAEDKTA